ncbi:MAG: hypothetical protein WCA35_00465 [Kovacikia sp.]
MRSAYLTKSISAATVRAINYTPELGQFLQHHQGADVSRLGNLASIRSPGSAMFRAINCSPEFGEEFLTQADIFAAEPTGRTIRPDTIPDLESRRVKNGQILIAGVGTLGETELYGRSIIADDRLVGKLLTSDTLVLEPTLDEDTHYYVYAFLCTSVGVRLVRSASAGTKLLRPRRDLLRNLPVPLPDRATLKKVADLIRTTVIERERYLREVQAARACLEALPEMQEAIAMCQERKARCIQWDSSLSTLTAWTYASPGKALAYLQKKWRARLGDFVGAGGIFRSGRYARVRCIPPYGVDFFSQRDAFLIRPIPQRILLPGSAATDLSCQAGTLLFGGQGTLGEGEIFGRVVIVDSEMAKAAVTEHLLRVQVTEEFSKLAFAFLSTIVGLRLVRSCAVGTKLLSLRPDLMSIAFS